MPVRLSKSQIDRLGLRLVREAGPAEDDLDLLHGLLLDRAGQLDRAEARVREALGVIPTSRVKNTGTILEKLRRGDGSGLKSIQDLAGMRIVGHFGRPGQDKLVERIVALFNDCERPPRVVDRRAEPMHGYRAVHVIVFPEGNPLEIQVRTEWQHEWAEFFEKLADLVGRGIRYGKLPERSVQSIQSEPGAGQALLAAEGRAHDALVGMALNAAGIIDVFEIAEARDPGSSRRDEYRHHVASIIEELDYWLGEVRKMGEITQQLRS